MPTCFAELARRLHKIGENLIEMDRQPPAEHILAEQKKAIIEELDDVETALNCTDAAPLGPEAARDTPARTGGLAVMIGHQAAKPGAVGACPPFSLHDRHEYRWNADLASRVEAFAKANEIRCKIFTRDGVGIRAAYARVKEWKPSATVELHFNSADDPGAKGSLTLHGGGTSESWARMLQDQMVALFGRQGHLEDRGVHVPGSASGYSRGAENVSQIYPSALIEPFFCSNPADAKLGIDRKQNLAEAVVDAYANFVGVPLSTPVSPTPIVNPSSVAPLPETPLFAELRQLYEKLPLDISGLDADVAASLKGITLAQWALESAWGDSTLATQHYNFAGMKALSEVEPILSQLRAEKTWHEAHDGFDWYLRFGNLEDFIRGYWMFLDRSPYRGWRDMAKRSPHDFLRFISRKWAQSSGYAEKVIAIERRIANAAQCDSASDQQPSDNGGTEINVGAIPEDASLFRELVERHMPSDPDLAKVKAVAAAQWAVESNWGRSALAAQHYNFAGIEWSDIFAGLASRVRHPTSPEKGDYCRFLNVEAFAKGYLHRLEHDPRFVGWREKTASAKTFIPFLSRRWRPDDPGYSQALSRRFRDLAKGAAHDTNSSGNSPDVVQPGFVIRLQRTHCERGRGQSYDRTVSQYQVYFNGQPLPELSGVAYERQGPGDNNPTGVQAHRRIKADTYALATHKGTSTNDAGVTLYQTLGFTDSTVPFAAPRPSVRLLNTGARSGILFHPGSNYLSSIGCINLSRALDPLGAIEWRDSRKHVIDIIGTMKARLEERFPAHNNQAIPNAFMIIQGEPGPAHVRGVAREARDRSAREFGLDQLDAIRAALTAEVSRERSLGDDFYILATALTASADAGKAEEGLFDRLTARASKLSVLRDEDNNSLWSPWVTACATVEAINDRSERDNAIIRLREIAAFLAGNRVPVDAWEGAHTPLTEAAIANSPAAAAELIHVGADVNLHDRQGMTPLHAAAFHGSVDAVRYLLEQGADPRIVTREPTAPTRGSADRNAEMLEPECCLAGQTAMECAQQGKRAAMGDEERLSAYEAAISLLWQREN